MKHKTQQSETTNKYLLIYINPNSKLEYFISDSLQKIELKLSEEFEWESDENLFELDEALVVDLSTGKVTHPTIKLQPKISWNFNE